MLHQGSLHMQELKNAHGVERKPACLKIFRGIFQELLITEQKFNHENLYD